MIGFRDSPPYAVARRKDACRTKFAVTQENLLRKPRNLRHWAAVDVVTKEVMFVVYPTSWDE